ncbi:hypothetical protein V6N13_000775 [Hibiscus sabdariffa]
MEKGGRQVVVSALQFACTDDVPTNLATAESHSYAPFPADSEHLNLLARKRIYTALVEKTLVFISFLA